VLHAKAAVFDDEILLAGSANLDHRSFRHNLEVAVNVFDGDAARRASDFLEREYAVAEEVTLDAWRHRPVRERLLERLASAFRYWL
jgi:cardiolipin synthase